MVLSTNDKVLAPCGAKHVYSQSMGTREHLTVHACACTNRMMLPPIIIFAGWFPGGAYTHGGLNLVIWMGSCIYCGLRKSSSSTALWIGQLFSSKTGTNHTTLSMIKTARYEKVVLCNLPPHTTHATQLDKSIFKPLKAVFGTALKSVTFARQDYILPKSDFTRVLSDPYNKTCTPFRAKHFVMLAFIRLTHPCKIKFEMLGP